MSKTNYNDFKEMVSFAIKAASGHNSQPWKFSIGENHIQIIPNLPLGIAVVDPDNRELFISLGCATENLCIAASALGYSSTVNIENTNITVKLLKSENTVANPLFEFIDKRQTNRKKYNGKVVTEQVLSSCIGTINQDDNFHIHTWGKRSTGFEPLKLFINKGISMQMTDEDYKKELKLWIRFNKKHSKATQDGLAYNTFSAPNLPAFITKAVINFVLNPKEQCKKEMKKIESSSHLILVTSKTDDMESWIKVGIYLERFILNLTQNGIVHTYLNQPCEIKYLREDLMNTLYLKQQIPQILLRVGYAKPAPRSRRRPLNEVIIE